LAKIDFELPAVDREQTGRQTNATDQPARQKFLKISASKKQTNAIAKSKRVLKNTNKHLYHQQQQQRHHQSTLCSNQRQPAN